ncbi:hypothetical protein ACVCIH_17890 [Burkholderia glumae]|uniref:hypothetical protein n=1 Tax=Burkholderia glumae TaxID=337 RepID=UPI002036C058|nr:hypothetical protein [Burkholderia glumae]MCM2493265.1 hypothetical protein [Burkholderia glumae]
MSDKLSDDERARERFRAAMSPLPCEWSERDGKFMDAGVQLAWFAWNKALAASPSPAISADRWQPIETAPKDGTSVIIARIEEGVVYDVWNGHFEVLEDDEEDGPWDIHGGEPWCSYKGRSAGTYFSCWLPGKEWDSLCLVGPGFEYTHWMPLPIGPTDDALKAAPAISESEDAVKDT